MAKKEKLFVSYIDKYVEEYHMNMDSVTLSIINHIANSIENGSLSIKNSFEVVEFYDTKVAKDVVSILFKASDHANGIQEKNRFRGYTVGINQLTSDKPF